MEHQSGLRVLLPYGRPYRGLLILGTFYAFLGATASAFNPVVLGYAIDALLDEQRSIMIGIVNDVIVHVPFTKAIKDDKPVNEKLLGVLQILSI